RLAALIDLANLDRLADFQRPAVRLLLTRDHPEERRLSGAVGADDADNAAARQREVEIVDEHVIAVALSKMPRLDDEVAEAWPGGDVDFSGVDFLRGFFAQQLFVGIEPRLAFCLPGARRHPDPFELALERPLTPRFGLLLEGEPLLLLLEPRRVITLPRDAASAIELENPAGDVVEKV